MARSEDNPRSHERDTKKEDEDPKGRTQRVEAAHHDPGAELEAKMKAWVRAEIALASSGVTEEERAKRNP